jgi:25S rRNA (uracil2634-N3)-methyltransferase
MLTALQRQQLRFSLNFNGAVRAPYINHQGTIQPMLSMPGPYLNVLPARGGIPPAIGNVTRPHFLAPEEQHRYMQRTIAGPPGRHNCYYFDHQLCLQREQEIQRQAMMPGATGLICSSAFFEDRRREYVQKQEWLCRNMPFCGLR